MNNIILNFFMQTGLAEPISRILSYGTIFILIIVITILITWVVRNILLKSIVYFIQNNNYHWDDALIQNHFFTILSWFVPIIILYIAQNLLLPAEIAITAFARQILLSAFVVVSVRCIASLLNSINDIYRTARKADSTPIRGYIDAAKIITYVLGAIFILAILTNRSPWGLLSVLGGLTAVTMLVFKDTILGFVASIQLSGTDMVRIGDWIEMPSHGADGDVIDISIHSVKVQNWDKTISTIPTYALVSNAFKNWRGMSESGGRRIKRALNVDMNSIRFVTDNELQEMGKIKLITEYIAGKQREIEEYNQQHGIDTSVLINGRRQTNVGIFKAYIIAFLRHHPQINRDMTFLVRHLQPGKNGLPIEIYVFSSDKVWANYEAIQADIFDHLLAALPVFDLRIFQTPSGYDFRHINRIPETSTGI
jgi:miniconductance mechanosensitive channel